MCSYCRDKRRLPTLGAWEATLLHFVPNPFVVAFAWATFFALVEIFIIRSHSFDGACLILGKALFVVPLMTLVLPIDCVISTLYSLHHSYGRLMSMNATEVFKFALSTFILLAVYRKYRYKHIVKTLCSTAYRAMLQDKTHVE
jgi:hypothetical protein